LENVESQHRQDFSTLVIEAVVLASFDDSEEQESSQASSPKHDKYTVDDLTCMMFAIHGNRDDGQNHKVGSSGDIVELVGLEDDRDGKEDGLVSECD